MDLKEAVASVEAAETIEDLRDRFDRIVQNCGFAGFGFMDAGLLARGERPLYIGSIGRAWEDEYRIQEFARVDPCVRIARRTNVPFLWSDVRLPERRAKQRLGAHATMEAAQDHGLRDGMVVPFHYRDHDGLYHSASSVFFWRDPSPKLKRLLEEKRVELHIVMIYWMQRAIDLLAVEHRKAPPPLKAMSLPESALLGDRERDVLAYAARGLTVTQTADALHISEHTVETHMRAAMSKLGARNKTHATALAIHMALIDP